MYHCMVFPVASWTCFIKFKLLFLRHGSHVMIRTAELPGSFTWTFLMAFSAEDPDCEVGPVSRKKGTNGKAQTPKVWIQGI